MTSLTDDEIKDYMARPSAALREAIIPGAAARTPWGKASDSTQLHYQEALSASLREMSGSEMPEHTILAAWDIYENSARDDAVEAFEQGIRAFLTAYANDCGIYDEEQDGSVTIHQETLADPRQPAVLVEPPPSLNTVSKLPVGPKVQFNFRCSLETKNRALFAAMDAGLNVADWLERLIIAATAGDHRLLRNEGVPSNPNALGEFLVHKSSRDTAARYMKRGDDV